MRIYRQLHGIARESLGSEVEYISFWVVVLFLWSLMGFGKDDIFEDDKKESNGKSAKKSSGPGGRGGSKGRGQKRSKVRSVKVFHADVLWVGVLGSRLSIGLSYVHHPPARSFSG